MSLARHFPSVIALCFLVAGNSSAQSADPPRELHVDPLPLRIREVVRGQSTFRFIVEPSGKINRCSIVLQEESSRAWTAAVLKKLRHARYEPARLQGRKVRQEVYQMFTYDTDGRMSQARP